MIPPVSPALYTSGGEPRDDLALNEKAIGLQEHQPVLAAHHDKDPLHVHIVVNTVNPDTGITAPLKFTKLDLSKWAEAYEREYGIHCQERIKNNAERERHAKSRKLDADDLLMGRTAKAAKPRKPYVPVKHKGPLASSVRKEGTLGPHEAAACAEMEVTRSSAMQPGTVSVTNGSN